MDFECVFAGVAQTSREDKVPYTTLMYATGGMNNFQYERKGSGFTRKDPTTVDTTAWDYSHIAAVPDDEAHHGGGDVAVYATGKEIKIRLIEWVYKKDKSQRFHGLKVFIAKKINQICIFYCRADGTFIPWRSRTNLCSSCDFLRSTNWTTQRI